MTLRDDFKKNGYVLLRQVITPEEVKNLRDILDNLYKSHESKHLLATPTIIPIPEIANIVSNSKILSALDQIFEHKFVVMPTIQVLRNMFAKPGSAWHVDSGSELRNDYIYDKNYCQVKCGVYLQDNTSEWGGAVDVVEGGHKFPIQTGLRKIDRQIKFKLNQLGQKYRSYTVPIKAGDALIFHSLLPHRSTWPQKMNNPIHDKNFMTNIPNEYRKYSVYWDVGSPVAANGFFNHQLSLANNKVDGYTTKSAALEYLSLDYPKDYPQDLVKKLGKYNTYIMTKTQT